MSRRSTVTTLPEDIQELLNELLQQGIGYREIAAKLGELGHPISKSSLHRYGQDYRERMLYVQSLREQAKAYVSEAGTGLELDEAAHQLAMDLVVRVLMKMDPATLAEGDPIKLLGSLAKLQSSGVKREALKASDRKRKAKEAVERIEEHPEVKQLPDDVRQHILQELYGVAV